MRTRVGIDGERFTVNGRPTYAGRRYDGLPVEGLLFNVRVVQATFDDEHEESVSKSAYPDTGVGPERNVEEFIAALPEYVAHA